MKKSRFSADQAGLRRRPLRNRIRQSERDRSVRAGSTTEERERIKALERENRELCQAHPAARRIELRFARGCSC